MLYMCIYLYMYIYVSQNFGANFLGETDDPMRDGMVSFVPHVHQLGMIMNPASILLKNHH